MAEPKPTQPAPSLGPIVPQRERVPFDSLPNEEKKALVRIWRQEQHDETVEEARLVALAEAIRNGVQFR